MKDENENKETERERERIKRDYGFPGMKEKEKREKETFGAAADVPNAPFSLAVLSTINGHTKSAQISMSFGFGREKERGNKKRYLSA